MTETAWHALATDEILDRLDTAAERGLDATEAERRLREAGPGGLRLHPGRRRKGLGPTRPDA